MPSKPKPQNLIRPLVQGLKPYVPGEQPRDKGLIKLNTNENACPPSPKVLAAVKAATDARLRLYPDPTAQSLREKLAKLHHCKPENIVVGNGSDELLAVAVRAFVEPAPAGSQQGFAPGGLIRLLRATVQYFVPGYSLYPVLADIHGAVRNPVPLGMDFVLPTIRQLRLGGHWNPRAALTFITTPNAPTGRGYATSDLEAICSKSQGVVVLDEAYAEFASENALSLALKYPNVLVSRTFSKAYSLCFQRIGYFVGHRELIAALQRIRDSYSVNGLGQVAAEAALGDSAYYQRVFKQVVDTREDTAAKLRDLGFDVLPSETNFLMVHPPRYSARDWLKKLRQRKVLVRWFDDSDVSANLRITIGTPAEMKKLLDVARQILK